MSSQDHRDSLVARARKTLADHRMYADERATTDRVTLTDAIVAYEDLIEDLIDLVDPWQFEEVDAIPGFDFRVGQQVTTDGDDRPGTITRLLISKLQGDQVVELERMIRGSVIASSFMPKHIRPAVTG